MDLSGRVFQIWDYSPSHRRLLIRSPRKDKTNSHIDIVFWGVKYLNVSSILRELSIEETEPRDEDYRMFTLRSNEGVFTIEAFECQIYTSEAPLFRGL